MEQHLLEEQYFWALMALRNLNPLQLTLACCCRGQVQPPGGGDPVFTPCSVLDYELEMVWP